MAGHIAAHVLLAKPCTPEQLRRHRSCESLDASSRLHDARSLLRLPVFIDELRERIVRETRDAPVLGRRAFTTRPGAATTTAVIATRATIIATTTTAIIATGATTATTLR